MKGIKPVHQQQKPSNGGTTPYIPLNKKQES